jgi:hypothetical protein
MKDNFRSLLEFDCRFSPEVLGHGFGTLDPTIQLLLERFVRGECDEGERRAVSAFLQQNPSWIRPVAEQIRTRWERGVHLNDRF